MLIALIGSCGYFAYFLCIDTWKICKDLTINMPNIWIGAHGLRFREVGSNEIISIGWDSVMAIEGTDNGRKGHPAWCIIRYKHPTTGKRSFYCYDFHDRGFKANKRIALYGIVTRYWNAYAH